MSMAIALHLFLILILSYHLNRTNKTVQAPNVFHRHIINQSKE